MDLLSTIGNPFQKQGGEERNSTEYSIINTGYPLFQETKKSKELDN